MNINDSYLAFIFDEACEYILSMKTKREVKEAGKVYLEDSWLKEPNWIDEVPKNKNINNSDLISEMKKNLERFQ
jgi:hypothetical protein